MAARDDGVLVAIDCLEVGLSSVGMGAGRQKVDDVLDMAAGVVFHRKCGDEVAAGDSVATLHCGDEALLAAAVERVGNALTVEGEPRPLPTLISHLVDKDGMHEWAPL